MMFLHDYRTLQYKENKQYRLRDFDYSGEGEYFVTICIDDRKHYFGEIKNGKMILSELGKIVNHTWNEIPDNFSNIKLDVHQLMPDHFHGIIIIKPENRKNLINQIPTRCKSTEFKSGIRNNPMELKSISLGRVIRWFKGRVKFEAKKINLNFRWQARFYDRIIRDEKEFFLLVNILLIIPPIGVKVF